jgi:hypothetical protein
VLGLAGGAVVNLAASGFDLGAWRWWLTGGVVVIGGVWAVLEYRRARPDPGTQDEAVAAPPVVDARHGQGVQLAGTQINNFYRAAGSDEVVWPLRAGVIPPSASAFHYRVGLTTAFDHAQASSTDPLPSVRKLPPRNAMFTGRRDLIGLLEQRLHESGPGVVQILHGLGGMGKSTLAAEYAHRFARRYDTVWWMDAEQAELINAQLAELAVAIGCAAPETDMLHAVESVRAWLNTTSRWLIVLDNADEPSDLLPLLPQGPGQLLVTTRNPAWAQLSAPIHIDVFTRQESTALLQLLVPHMPEADADRLSSGIGDLPLAVAQSAAVVAEAGLSVDGYLHELDRSSQKYCPMENPPAIPRP